MPWSGETVVQTLVVACTGVVALILIAADDPSLVCTVWLVMMKEGVD